MTRSAMNPTGKPWPSRKTMVAVLFVLAGLGFYLWRSQNNQAKPADSTDVTPKIVSVTALGYLEPRGKVIKLSAPMVSGGTGRVERLLVKQGDTVKIGQVIAILDSYDRLQAALLQAQRQVKVAQSNLAVVKEGAKVGEIDSQAAEVSRTRAQSLGEERAQRETIGRLEAQWDGDKAIQAATIKRLEAELSNARSEARRYQQLYQEGAISQSVYDSKRLPTQTLVQQLNESKASLERTVITGRKQIQEASVILDRIQQTSRQQVNSAEATLDRIAEVRPVDVGASQAQVDQAIAAVQLAQSQLNQASVLSPQDGVVLDIHTRPGELVSTEGIVELGSTQQMTALLEVYETDISKIKLGQPTRLFADRHAEALSGTVSEIGVKVKRQNIVNSDTSSNIDARIIEVRVQLDAASIKNVAGLTNLQVTGEIQQ